MRLNKTIFRICVATGILCILIVSLNEIALFDQNEWSSGVLDTEPIPITAYDTSAFLLVWDITLTITGSSASNQAKLPLHMTGNYAFVPYTSNITNTKLGEFEGIENE